MESLQKFKSIDEYPVAPPECQFLDEESVLEGQKYIEQIIQERAAIDRASWCALHRDETLLTQK